MIDQYPTRKFPVAKFLERKEPVAYSAHMETYSQNGYWVIKNYFDKAPTADADSGLVTTEPDSIVTRSLTGVHNHEPYKSFSKTPSLITLARLILGSPVYIHQSRINFKHPLVGSGWHWHSDFETWHSQDGMPGMRCLTAMIPLTENTAFNGPLLVIPGSHKRFWSAPKPTQQFSAQENFADQKEGIPDTEAIKEFLTDSNGKIEQIICSPGDLVLFDCNIIHGSVANMSGEARTNLFFVYNSIHNKLQAPFSSEEPRPEEMGARVNMEVL